MGPFFFVSSGILLLTDSRPGLRYRLRVALDSEFVPGYTEDLQGIVVALGPPQPLPHHLCPVPSVGEVSGQLHIAWNDCNSWGDRVTGGASITGFIVEMKELLGETWKVLAGGVKTLEVSVGAIYTCSE